MPNLVKFREDPDAMLVMSLEDYDEETGKAAKAAIMKKDVVGKTPPITHVRMAEEGLLVSLNQPGGAVDLPFIGTLYGKPKAQIVAELGDLIFPDPDPEPGKPPTLISLATSAPNLPPPRPPAPNMPAMPTPCEPCSRRTAARRHRRRSRRAVDTGELRHPGIRRRSFPRRCVQRPHRPPKKDAVWSIDPNYAAKASVAATSEYGTARANGTWLLDLALNMKTPTIYDTIMNGDREERVVNQEANNGRPREAEAHQGAFPLLDLHRSRFVRSGLPGCTTTPTTTSVPACLTVRTSTSPA